MQTVVTPAFYISSREQMSKSFKLELEIPQLNKLKLISNNDLVTLFGPLGFEYVIEWYV